MIKYKYIYILYIVYFVFYILHFFLLYIICSIFQNIFYIFYIFFYFCILHIIYYIFDIILFFWYIILNILSNLIYIYLFIYFKCDYFGSPFGTVFLSQQPKWSMRTCSNIPRFTFTIHAVISTQVMHGSAYIDSKLFQIQVCCSISSWLAKLPPRVLESQYDGVCQGVKKPPGQSWVKLLVRSHECTSSKNWDNREDRKCERHSACCTFVIGNTCVDILRQLPARWEYISRIILLCKLYRTFVWEQNMLHCASPQLCDLSGNASLINIRPLAIEKGIASGVVQGS